MSKPVRVITCEITGLTFNYSGRGRPPKYHPSVKAEVQKQQRKAVRDRKAGKAAE